MELNDQPKGSANADVDDLKYHDGSGNQRRGITGMGTLDVSTQSGTTALSQTDIYRRDTLISFRPWLLEPTC